MPTPHTDEKFRLKAFMRITREGASHVAPSAALSRPRMLGVGPRVAAVEHDDATRSSGGGSHPAASVQVPPSAPPPSPVDVPEVVSVSDNSLVTVPEVDGEFQRRAPLLGGLACVAPEVFVWEVVSRLTPTDRALLSRTCRAVRALVVASGYPRAGAMGSGGNCVSSHGTEVGVCEPRRGAEVHLGTDGRSRTRREPDVVTAGETRVGPYASRRHPPLLARHFTRALGLTRWALANGLPLHWRTMEDAASDGDTAVLAALKEEHGCPWNWRTCAAAARGGHLEALLWAKTRGCGFPWDVICAFAAVGGSLPVLQWARRNGCPWDAECAAAAAEGGHLEVLKWAVANGCPWDADTVAAAEKNNHEHVLAWAVAAGCPVR